LSEGLLDGDELLVSLTQGICSLAEQLEASVQGICTMPFVSIALQTEGCSICTGKCKDRPGSLLRIPRVSQSLHCTFSGPKPFSK
jgi:hypothetical protein